MVRCRKCGTRYETSLPATSVRRVARCPTCGLRALEVVDDGGASGAADGTGDEQRRQGRHRRPREA